MSASSFASLRRFSRALLLLLPLAACTKGYDLKPYYYPLKDLKPGLVYEYRPVDNDSTAPYYWYYQLLERSEGRFLTASRYDQRLEVSQFSTEELVANGTLVTQYMLYQTDTSGRQRQIPAAIQAPNYFPFDVPDTNTVFLFKIQWKDPADTAHVTTLVRNRRFTGFVQYPFQGVQRECARFEVRDLIDDYRNGHLELRFEGEEYYAKGIGLVYTRRETAGLRQEYRLADRYDMTRLEEQARQRR